MGYLERNSETLKTPGFSGFDSRVSGFSRVVIFGFGSGSGSKKVGLFARVSGFRVQIPITSWGKPMFFPVTSRYENMIIARRSHAIIFLSSLSGKKLEKL